MPNAEFIIEEVKDLQAVLPELRQMFFESEDYNRSFIERQLRSDWEGRWLDHMALGDDRLILIARADRQAVGYINVEIIRDFGLFERIFGYVNHAFVRSEWRSQGIGRAMLTVTEVWCRERGVDQLQLDVWAANKLASRFWTLAGFELQSMTMRKPLKEERR
jgi:GNAT superfamily N-acetyltransferase